MTNPAHSELRQAAAQAREALADLPVMHGVLEPDQALKAKAAIASLDAALQQHSPQQGQEQAGQMVSDEQISDRVADAAIDADLPPQWCLDNAAQLNKLARALLSASPVREGAAPKGSRPSKEWYAAMIAQTLDDDIVIGSGAPMDAAGNPKLPRHKFWGAGEPDCPADLKAPNGELHSMRCKVCGDGWRNSVDVCFAALRAAPKGEAADEQKRQAYQAMCRAHSYCPSDLPHLRKMQWQGEYMLNALLAMGATPIAPPAAQPATSSEAAPAPAPNACRVELVTAMHGLISQIENTLYAFGEDAEARRQAEGAVRHARKVADRWNWNGPWEKTPAAQPAAPTMEAPVGVPLFNKLLSKMPALDLTWPEPVRDGWMRCFNTLRELAAAPAGESNERAASGQDEGNGNG